MDFLGACCRGPIVGRSSRLLQLEVVSWMFVVLCELEGRLTGATKCEWHEEPGPIGYNVAKMYKSGDCEEYAKSPASWSARVVCVEIEVRFAFSSREECSVQHDDVSIGRKELR